MNRDDYLLAFLREHTAACPVCGYELRGLEATLCPECGAALELSVGSSTPRMGPWIFATISTALALGFDSVACVLISTGLVLNPPPASARPQVLTILLEFVLLALVVLGGVLLLIRWRRRVWRMDRDRAWLLAWALFLSIGAVHVLFGLKVAGLI